MQDAFKLDFVLLRGLIATPFRSWFLRLVDWSFFAIPIEFELI